MKVFRKAGIPMPYPYRQARTAYQKDKWLGLFWDWACGDFKSLEDFVKTTFKLDVYL